MREEDIGERWPEVPEWAEVDDLSPDVRRDLRGLSKEGAEFVAQHLVAAGTLADEEPEQAWVHARAARSKGGRIAVVRETVGLVAYRAGEWAEAISELRAARRMGGGPGHLAVMADCERALGHPEKAIELSRSAEAEQLDDDGKIELTVVVAGARADLGQVETAMVVLENSGLQEDVVDPRLLYAYADLLVAAGRRPEALDWFMKAYDADVDDDTDAAERIAELTDDVVAPEDEDDTVVDVDDSDDDEPGTDSIDDSGDGNDSGGDIGNDVDDSDADGAELYADDDSDDDGADDDSRVIDTDVEDADDTEVDTVEIDSPPSTEPAGEDNTESVTDAIADDGAGTDGDGTDGEVTDGEVTDEHLSAESAVAEGAATEQEPAPADGQLPFFSDPLFSDTDGPSSPDDRR